MRYNRYALIKAGMFSLSTHGRDYRLSKNFVLSEFASKDGANAVYIHPALVALLQDIRDHFDKPVTINSAYRSFEHNRAIGGAISSRHLYGLAADIVVKDVPPGAVAKYAELVEAGGVGRYANFCHIDVEGIGRRWSG